VASLARDLPALFLQWQPVDLDDVIQHAGENGHHLAEFLPVEFRLVRERSTHELGQVDRTQQAGAVGRQRLLTTGIGGAYVLAEPVVVHLVDLVDQDEPRFGKIIGRTHDHVPQAARRYGLVHLAGHQPGIVGDVITLDWPLPPDHPT
jgi:hypothetical protein